MPTVAESGLAGFDIGSWNGVLAPAGTPKEIVTFLNAEIVQILARPDVKERLSSLGAEPAAMTPAQYATVIKADLSKWAKIVKESGISLDEFR